MYCLHTKVSTADLVFRRPCCTRRYAGPSRALFRVHVADSSAVTRIRSSRLEKSYKDVCVSG
ncbi:hypothetical protein E2C01_018780 [Portunus trituberculatus]|uniref:Uncharacterized protein n=1 Tax=Portunus trituberculatus TaxID=210409 RepID=A0A5B7DW65_PORTR|nr:hypothetical protein [Portunus trituberculatus]